MSKNHRWTGSPKVPGTGLTQREVDWALTTGINLLEPDSPLMKPGDASYVTATDRVEVMLEDGEIVPIMAGETGRAPPAPIEAELEEPTEPPKPTTVELCYNRDTGELLATGTAASRYYLDHAKRLAAEGTIIAYASGETDGWDPGRLLKDPDYRVAYGRFRRGTGTGAKR